MRANPSLVPNYYASAGLVEISIFALEDCQLPTERNENPELVKRHYQKHVSLYDKKETRTHIHAVLNIWIIWRSNRTQKRKLSDTTAHNHCIHSDGWNLNERAARKHFDVPPRWWTRHDSGCGMCACVCVKCVVLYVQRADMCVHAKSPQCG